LHAFFIHQQAWKPSLPQQFPASCKGGMSFPPVRMAAGSSRHSHWQKFHVGLFPLSARPFLAIDFVGDYF
jgi:hypothetical protein